ncbi:MAG: CehA/McbA family metallohydrolase [Gemmatimonadota bacterium]
MSTLARVMLAAALLLVGTGEANGQAAVSRWYRGNTHTHTLNTDGDSPPDVVVRWYREHGYQFLFITDHEFITDVGPLNQLFGAAGKFLVISAQEVTQRVADASHPEKMRQAHVNALGVTRVIMPLGERTIATGTTVGATYARNLPLIRAAGGIPQVNHPNFRWSVPLSEMLGLPDSMLFEVWNGHPLVHNLGGTDSLGRYMPSTEALWDSLLTRGKYLMAVADDDSHSYHPEDAEKADLARPGRGWIMVRADTLTPESILRALGRGEFYATNGVTLRDYRVVGREIRVDVAQFSDNRFLTEFIGREGRVLASSTALKARYTIKGDEGYVRARVTDSMGRRAWMQPVRVAP